MLFTSTRKRTTIRTPYQATHLNITMVSYIALLCILYQNIPIFGITYWVRLMSKNTSMTLGSHFDEFISSQLILGRYGSASEVVRAGLRLLEDNATKLETLRQLLIEGENSGFVDYSYDELISELDNESH